MPQKNSPPSTSASSPSVSHTPPGSPNSGSDKEELIHTHVLSPSNIPLRPVHAPDVSTHILTVDSTPIMSTPSVEEMDIDDSTSDPSPSSSPNRNVAGGSDEGSVTGSDQEWSAEDWMADMRRVKVYELIGTTWTDRGTALCTGVYDEEMDSAAIVAKSEVNDVELLRSEIRASDVYQKQQDTLIVWTEPDGTDYALSFQDMEGCSEIWDFVVEVQRHFRGKSHPDPNSSFPGSSPDSQSRLTVASIIASGRLPEPALGIIGDLDTAIKAIAKTIHGRERICEYILNEEYIKSLIDVMEQAEDLESLPDLHALHTVISTILSMNDHGIYEYVLNENIYFGVVGILEYDPEFPTFKASYRDFLKNSAAFQRSFELRDPPVQKKIQQTYRLQYLKDVVLARVIDDSTFNVLNSFILFNQIDIINHVMQDQSLLPALFRPFVTNHDILQAGSGAANAAGTTGPLTLYGVNGVPLTNGKLREQAPSPPPSTQTASNSFASASSASLSNPDDSSSLPSPLSIRFEGKILASTKSDVIRFVHQLSLMGKNVQIPTRIALYRNLVEKGVLFALEWALRQPLPGFANSATNSESRLASYPAASSAHVNGNVSTAASSSLFTPTIATKAESESNLSSLPSNPKPNSHSTPNGVPSIPIPNVDPDPPLLDMVAEILIIIIDHNISGVRAHIVRQNDVMKAEKEKGDLQATMRRWESVTSTASLGAAKSIAGPQQQIPKKAETTRMEDGEYPHLLKALVTRLGGTRDVPFKNQIGDAIRLLLEVPPNLDVHANPEQQKNNALAKLREDPVNEHFFPVFYDAGTATAFFKGLLDLPEWKGVRNPVLKLPRELSALLLYLCDLLCTLLIQHSHRSQYFVMSCNISSRIASLLKTRDKHMRLAAMRFFRTCIRINNSFVIRHLIKHDIFSPILSLTEEEADRDNLVSASCQEFFECIRKDNLRLPMTHIMQQHEARIRALEPRDLVGPRFHAFMLRWEQNSQPPPPPSVEPTPEIDRSGARRWGQEDDEDYFNGPDDDDDLPSPNFSPTGASSMTSTWTRAQQQSAQTVAGKRGLRGVGRGAIATRGASPGRVGTPGLVAGSVTLAPRPTTPTPSSPTLRSSGLSNAIIVPQVFPMRSLLDYGDGDEDGDDEEFGPMPAEQSETSPSSSRGVGSSTSSSSKAAVDRKLQRTESIADLGDYNARASTSTSNDNLPAFNSDFNPVQRPRGGSIASPGSNEPVVVPASTPPLKRRRSEDDDDDQLASLARRSSTRRKSADGSASSSSQSNSSVVSISSAKGKGKEASISSRHEESETGTEEKGSSAKKIRLSLKAALGMGAKDKERRPARPPSPSVAATTHVKDGDGG